MIGGDDEGHCVLTSVRQTDCEILQSKLFRSFEGAAAQRHMGLSSLVRHDLHIAPGNAAQTRSQRFGDGFLAGEARRQFWRSSPAELDLGIGIDAQQKALAEASERSFYAEYFYYVDACRMHDSLVNQLLALQQRLGADEQLLQPDLFRRKAHCQAH